MSGPGSALGMATWSNDSMAMGQKPGKARRRSSRPSAPRRRGAVLAVGGQAAGGEAHERLGGDGQLAGGGTVARRAQLGPLAELELVAAFRCRRADGDRRVLGRAGLAGRELADEADHRRQPVDEQGGGLVGDLGVGVERGEHVPAVQRRARTAGSRLPWPRRSAPAGTAGPPPSPPARRRCGPPTRRPSDRRPPRRRRRRRSGPARSSGPRPPGSRPPCRWRWPARSRRRCRGATAPGRRSTPRPSTVPRGRRRRRRRRTRRGDRVRCAGRRSRSGGPVP